MVALRDVVLKAFYGALFLVASVAASKKSSIFGSAKDKFLVIENVNPVVTRKIIDHFHNAGQVSRVALVFLNDDLRDPEAVETGRVALNAKFIVGMRTPRDYDDRISVLDPYRMEAIISTLRFNYNNAMGAELKYVLLPSSPAKIHSGIVRAQGLVTFGPSSLIKVYQGTEEVEKRIKSGLKSRLATCTHLSDQIKNAKRKDSERSKESRHKKSSKRTSKHVSDSDSDDSEEESKKPSRRKAKHVSDSDSNDSEEDSDESSSSESDEEEEAADGGKKRNDSDFTSDSSEEESDQSEDTEGSISDGPQDIHLHSKAKGSLSRRQPSSTRPNASKYPVYSGGNGAEPVKKSKVTPVHVEEEPVAQFDESQLDMETVCAYLESVERHFSIKSKGGQKLAVNADLSEDYLPVVLNYMKVKDGLFDDMMATLSAATQDDDA